MLLVKKWNDVKHAARGSHRAKVGKQSAFLTLSEPSAAPSERVAAVADVGKC